MDRNQGRAWRAVATFAAAGIAMALPVARAEASSTGLSIDKAGPGYLVPVRAGNSTAGTVSIPAAPSSGVQTATIQVTYNGFSPQAQTAFQSAVNVWQTRINSPKIIHVTANWTPLGPGVLGSAGPTGIYKFTGGTEAIPAALAEAMCNCDGPNPTEINANFNSTFPDWYLGTDGNPPSTKYDFVSVVLHELGHGLGFAGSMGVSGANGGWGYIFSPDPTIYPTRYDTKEMTASTGGNQLVNTSIYPNPGPALKTELTDGTVFFNGTNANAANGGARPKLYAPNPWQPGSSNAHFDEVAFPTGTANALMTPFLANGESIHEPGAVTLGLFQDIGWTVNLPSLPTLSIANVSKVETDAGTTFKLKVTMSAASASAVTVKFSTADGTAIAPGDYTAQSNKTLTIPAGITSKSIKIKIIGDMTVEPNETFFVNLSNPVGATIADGQGQGTIQNDD